MTSRNRNPRGEGARLREEIVAAAIAVVDDPTSDAALSLRGIARRAGISAPAIYAHFADLAAVTDAVLATSFRQLGDQVSTATHDVPGPVEAVRAAGLAYVTFGWEHRSRYALMFSPAGYAPDAVDVFRQVEQLIGTCVRAGASTSADPHGDAYALWVALHGMATLAKPDRDDYLRLGPLDRRATVTMLVDRLARLTR